MRPPARTMVPTKATSSTWLRKPPSSWRVASTIRSTSGFRLNPTRCVSSSGSNRSSTFCPARRRRILKFLERAPIARFASAAWDAMTDQYGHQRIATFYPGGLDHFFRCGGFGHFLCRCQVTGRFKRMCHEFTGCDMHRVAKGRRIVCRFWWRSHGDWRQVGITVECATAKQAETERGSEKKYKEDKTLEPGRRADTRTQIMDAILRLVLYCVDLAQFFPHG